MLSHGSGIEYAFSDGYVSGAYDTGGFAGTIAAPGAPNTLFACISFADWVIAETEEAEPGINRLVGNMEHEGVNNCYAYLGTVVAELTNLRYANLRHISPNPYGADGGDINKQTIEAILARLGWDSRYWLLDSDESVAVQKPRLISLYNF